MHEIVKDTDFKVGLSAEFHKSSNLFIIYLHVGTDQRTKSNNFVVPTGELEAYSLVNY